MENSEEPRSGPVGGTNTEKPGCGPIVLLIFAVLLGIGMLINLFGGDDYPDRVTVSNGATRQCDGNGNVVGVGDFQQDARRLCAQKG